MKDIINRLIELSDKSLKLGDFPVSAIVYDDNYNIKGEGYNARNLSNITTDHAEIIAVNDANKKLKSWRLDNYNMIVTLEPCDMCKNVIREARIKKVIYLVKRFEYKNINKKTIFEFYEADSETEKQIIADYMTKISEFFVDKR